MIYETGHPHVPPSDWQTFRKEFSPYLIDEVIDRSETNLPDWFVPLGRRGAIASDALLRKAGYRHGSKDPRRWQQIECDIYERKIPRIGFTPPKRLMVRGCDKQQLWTVERWSDMRRNDNADEVLVYLFGSTPIFTRSYQSAMQLAEYCDINGPPSVLRWIDACPINTDGAIAFARKCRIDEARCNSLSPFNRPADGG